MFPSFESPLGSTGCGSSPDYVPAKLRPFLAHCLKICNLQETDWWRVPGADYKDTYWLRMGFLDVVEKALALDEEDNPPDSIDSGFDIYDDIEIYPRDEDGEPLVEDDERTRINWSYVGRDDEGVYCFDLWATKSGSIAYWLSQDGLDDREAVEKTIAEARGAVERFKRPESRGGDHHGKGSYERTC